MAINRYLEGKTPEEVAEFNQKRQASRDFWRSFMHRTQPTDKQASFIASDVRDMGRDERAATRSVEEFDKSEKQSYSRILGEIRKKNGTAEERAVFNRLEQLEEFIKDPVARDPLTRKERADLEKQIEKDLAYLWTPEETAAREARAKEFWDQVWKKEYHKQWKRGDFRYDDDQVSLRQEWEKLTGWVDDTTLPPAERRQRLEGAKKDFYDWSLARHVKEKEAALKKYYTPPIALSKDEAALLKRAVREVATPDEMKGVNRLYSVDSYDGLGPEVNWIVQLFMAPTPRVIKWNAVTTIKTWSLIKKVERWMAEHAPDLMERMLMKPKVTTEEAQAWFDAMSKSRQQAFLKALEETEKLGKGETEAEKLVRVRNWIEKRKQEGRFLAGGGTEEQLFYQAWNEMKSKQQTPPASQQ